MNFEYEFEFDGRLLAVEGPVYGIRFPNEDSDGGVWFNDHSESELDAMVAHLRKSEVYAYRNCYKVRLTFERA